MNDSKLTHAVSNTWTAKILEKELKRTECYRITNYNSHFHSVKKFNNSPQRFFTFFFFSLFFCYQFESFKRIQHFFILVFVLLFDVEHFVSFVHLQFTQRRHKMTFKIFKNIKIESRENLNTKKKNHLTFVCAFFFIVIFVSNITISDIKVRKRGIRTENEICISSCELL